MLLRILPPLEIADLGSGEGLISELLARRAKRVIAVDNSERIIAFGRDKAAKMGMSNLEFRLGDLENPPIEPGTMDLVILSQALHHASNPEVAVRSSFRTLRKGGQVLILDLREHGFEKARELYGDQWLGFKESELQKWLEAAGYKQIEISVVAREEQPPYFETVLAGAVKPA
jgi:ArsR family transcriptional regulator